MLLQVTNSGGLDAYDLRGIGINDDGVINYQGDSVFPGEEGTCQSLLPSGESCIIALEFSPESSGDYELNFELSFNDGVNPSKKEIKIHGNAGEVAVLKSEENFDGYLGVHEPASIVEKIVKITNTGGLKAKNITTLFEGAPYYGFKGGEYPGTGGTCTKTIDAGHSCEIVLSYLNPGQGSSEVILNLNYNNALTDETYILAFNAISAEIIANIKVLGYTDYDFGKIIQGKKVSMEFRIVNSGYAAATALTPSVPSPYSIESTTCQSELSPSQSCLINISLTPETLGKAQHFLSIDFSNGKTPTTFQLPMNVEGVKPGSLRFLSGISELTTMDLGTVGVNDERSIFLTINNNGSASAQSFQIAALPQGITFLGVTNCSNVINKGESCNLSLKFKATQVGDYEEQVTLNYFNGAKTTQSTLTIKATRKSLAVLKFAELGTSIDFGQLITNSSFKRSVTIKNVGTTTAQSLNIPALSDPLNFEGGIYPGLSGSCGTELGPGQNCTLAFEILTPTPYANYQTLSVDYFDSEMTQNLSTYVVVDIKAEAELAVTAIQRAVKGFNASPQNPKNMGDFNTVAPARIYIKIQNIGGNTSLNAQVQVISSDPAHSSEITILTGDDDGRVCDFDVITASEECYIILSFLPTTTGQRSFTVQVNYEGSENKNLILTQDLVMNGAELGVLSYKMLPLNNFKYPYVFEPVAQNGTLEKVFVVQNIGTTTVTQMDQDPLNSPFSLSTSAQLPGRCGTTLAPSETCLLGIRLTPPLKINYTSQSILSYHDGANLVEDTLYLSGNGSSPANLTITEAPEYDFGLVVVNTYKDKIFTLRNIGGSRASSIQFTGLNLPFKIQSDDCPETGLMAGETCLITVRFQPTVAGLQVNQSLSVDYFDGITSKSISRNIKGVGEPPLANHGGWASITARGDKVNVYGISSNDKEIRFSWNPMTSTGTITGYQVFRRTAATNYDFTMPLANITNTTTRSFVDTDFSHGTIYYYTVRAVILGLPARSTQVFSELRISAPLINMALVHRWMVNTDICTRMGKSIDRNNNHRCIYEGVGATVDKYFDLGYDLLVDRFEVGQDLTSRFGQSPNSLMGQTAAQQVCQNQGTFILVGHPSNGLKKRLLSRKEWIAASSWPSSLPATQITSREGGATNTTNCNGQSGTSIEITGNNSSCASRYGIEDMAGNAWEWTNERILNRNGFTPGGSIPEEDFKLDVDNDDFDNFDFSSITQETLLKDSTCISIPMRFPTATSSCSEGSLNPINLPDGGASSLYNATYIPPTTGAQYLIAGGSFGSTGRSSVYTMGWVPSNFKQAAARCAIRVD